MPRPRLRETHPFIEELVAKFECKDIAQLAERVGIPKSTLYTIADANGKNRIMEAHYRIASTLGIPWQTYTKKLLKLD
jgi:predicted transcriptional regulator